MEIMRTYTVNGLDSFTLYLSIDLKVGNQLYSSIPMLFLKKYLPIKNLAFAYLPDKEMAQELLNELAEQIKSLPDSSMFYYPEYILCEGVISVERVDYILIKQNKLGIWVRTHYCQFNRPVDFFILRSIYIAERHIYHCSMRNMTLEDFEDYLLTPEMKRDYARLYRQGCKAYKVVEDDEICYTMLVTDTEELLMVVSI